MQGYPIRIIIPGHIGGRMVKWLEEITVTSGESDNFYHFHDNRVLPPGIDQERAKAEGAHAYHVKWRFLARSTCKIMRDLLAVKAVFISSMQFQWRGKGLLCEYEGVLGNVESCKEGTKVLLTW